MHSLLANRGYTDGFFERHHTHEYQSYMQSSSQSHKQKFVAEMISCDKQAGTMDVDVKNRFGVGDRLELVIPNGKNIDFTLESIHNLKDGAAMDVAPGSGYKVRLPIPNVDADIAFLARYSN